ncbi:LOW QUALITY PROTEIN: pyruvate dehydrogenase protein X component-like [Vespula maculifrons]|uniref:Pyruvate dehydrogenase protein X component-like n=1 Tax=Vespula maculifrons TaxID=7453 RepID=A0ABD2CYJ5_VESMC
MITLYVLLGDSLEAITKMMTTLSYDRRAIAEDDAADFLAVLRAIGSSFSCYWKNPSIKTYERLNTQCTYSKERRTMIRFTNVLHKFVVTFSKIRV